MPRDRLIDAEEIALFRQAVGDVEPLAHTHIEIAPATRPSPRPRQREQDDEHVLQDLLSDHFEPADLDAGEELEYRQNGVQRRIVNQLRRGQFRVGADIDLHGMNVSAARSCLNAFLMLARREHMSCVRIIHGKGRRSKQRGPVLKQKVNHWLRQREEVLAFCSARPMDGGTGAVYVLLRAR